MECFIEILLVSVRRNDCHCMTNDVHDKKVRSSMLICMWVRPGHRCLYLCGSGQVIYQLDSKDHTYLLMKNR